MVPILHGKVYPKPAKRLVRVDLHARTLGLLGRNVRFAAISQACWAWRLQRFNFLNGHGIHDRPVGWCLPLFRAPKPWAFIRTKYLESHARVRKCIPKTIVIEFKAGGLFLELTYVVESAQNWLLVSMFAHRVLKLPPVAEADCQVFPCASFAFVTGGPPGCVDFIDPIAGHRPQQCFLDPWAMGYRFYLVMIHDLNGTFPWVRGILAGPGAHHWLLLSLYRLEKGSTICHLFLVSAGQQARSAGIGRGVMGNVGSRWPYLTILQPAWPVWMVTQSVIRLGGSGGINSAFLPGLVWRVVVWA